MATIDLSSIPIRTANEVIRGYGSTHQDVDILNPDAKHYIAVGLTHPVNVSIKGSAGYFCGGLSDGPKIEVKNNVSWGVGDNMLSGSIVVGGNAGAIAGEALRGGEIVVRGNMGSRAGQVMKKGTLCCGGNSSFMAGYMMYGGRMIILGNSGEKVGENMAGGEIYVGGEIESLGSDAMILSPTPDETASIMTFLAKYDIPFSGKFTKVVCAGKDLSCGTPEPPLKNTPFTQFSGENTAYWNTKVLDDITVKSHIGRYRIRGYGTSRHLPHFNDIAFKKDVEINPANSNTPIDMRTFIGDRSQGKALDLSMPVVIAPMSLGAVSPRVKTALGIASRLSGICENTGEGGMYSVERAEARQLIYQCLSGRLGWNIHDMKRSDALELPFLFTGFDTAPDLVKRALSQAISHCGCGYMGQRPLCGDTTLDAAHTPSSTPDDNPSPWFQLIKPGDTPSPSAAALVYIMDKTNPDRLDRLKYAPLRPGQLMGLCVDSKTLPRGLCHALDNKFDILLLDSSSGMAGTWPELDGNFDLTVIRDTILRLRSKNMEEEICLMNFGGLRSGTDVAKALALNCNASVFGTAMAIAMGGQINGNTIEFPPLLSSAHEDANGQYEVNFDWTNAVHTSDRLVHFRMMAGQVAQKYGATATFMAKPFENLSGSGAHLHFHIANAITGENCFPLNPGEEDWKGLGISKTALHYIGGLLKHVRAITAVASPNINCYRRIQSGEFVYSSDSGYTWTPSFASYGDNNRTQLFRCPATNRMEDRSPSGMVNPYLLMAVNIAAGLDGIRNEIDPGEAIVGKNIWNLSIQERKDLGMILLPQNLLEAVEALEADDVIQAGALPVSAINY